MIVIKILYKVIIIKTAIWSYIVFIFSILFVRIDFFFFYVDSARRQDPVLNRIRIDNDKSSKRTHEDGSFLLNVNTNDNESVLVREPLRPNDGQNHSNNKLHNCTITIWCSKKRT